MFCVHNTSSMRLFRVVYQVRCPRPLKTGWDKLKLAGMKDWIKSIYTIWIGSKIYFKKNKEIFLVNTFVGWVFSLYILQILETYPFYAHSQTQSTKSVCLNVKRWILWNIYGWLIFFLFRAKCSSNVKLNRSSTTVSIKIFSEWFELSTTEESR